MSQVRTYNPISASAPLFEARGLSKAYTGGGVFAKLMGGRVGDGRGPAAVEALRGVSLTIREGETLGLIGESGCGKSTLGYIVARALPPDEGELLWNGRAVGAAGKGRGNAGYAVQIVFQDLGASLNPAHMIGWMFHEALRAHGITDRAERERRIHDMLPRVGLDGYYLRRYQHELSGGQKQRVAIMLALLMEPRLIVADEIVSSLDVSVRAQILNLLRELQALYGLSYLFISHEIDVVYYLAHTIAVMYRGEVVEEGPAEAVYNAALHPYTQSLLRESGRMEPDRGQTGPAREHAPSSDVTTRSDTVEQSDITGQLAMTEQSPTTERSYPAGAGTGCGYYERCRHALPACALAHPNLTERIPGHRVRCAFL